MRNFYAKQISLGSCIYADFSTSHMLQNETVMLLFKAFKGKQIHGIAPSDFLFHSITDI